jgi:hypothetical protein
MKILVPVTSYILHHIWKQEEKISNQISGGQRLAYYVMLALISNGRPGSNLIWAKEKMHQQKNAPKAEKKFTGTFKAESFPAKRPRCNQCWGTVKFWCGSGSALWLTDPDPAPDLNPFFRNFKDAKKQNFIFFYNLPAGTLSSALKI